MCKKQWCRCCKWDAALRNLHCNCMRVAHDLLLYVLSILLCSCQVLHCTSVLFLQLKVLLLENRELLC